MSVIRTFTVTVSNPGSGNRYYIDGVLQETVNLAEGYTYKFDVSDSSVSGHPFKFSTTSNGTHSGGSEYTTGVTTSGNAGDNGSYVQIVVAASAPQLYYYCQYHSGMGGQANTPLSDSWNVLPWGINEYGNQDTFNVSVTGLSSTTTLGNFSSVGSEEGWGSDFYGVESWGESGNTILLDGLQATVSFGEISAYGEQGWGRDFYGLETWGESADPSTLLAGFSLTSTLGEFPYAQSTTGWGRDSWNQNAWGEDGINVSLAGLGLTATASLPSVGWGNQVFGSDNEGWGGIYQLNPADVMGLTGLSLQSALGTTTTKSDTTFTLTGISLQSSLGLVQTDDHSVGLTGLSAQTSLGTATAVAVTITTLTGLSAQTNVGSVDITSNPIIQLTGLSAQTTLGGVTIDSVVVGIPGLSSQTALGALISVQATVANLNGLGLTATTILNDAINLQYFNRKVPKDSTGYSRKVPKDSTGYTRKVAN